MKKILIITYYWPPSGGPGVQRWLKFTKYLRDFNIEPIIVTVDANKASYPVTDLSLEKQIPQGIQVARTNSFEPLKIFSSFFKKEKVPYAGIPDRDKMSLVGKLSLYARANFFIPDARIGWNKYAFKKCCEIIEQEKIDFIVTTSPPHSTQLIGLKLKQKYNLKWLADLRDPWTDIYYYHKLHHSEKAKAKDLQLEKMVLTEADIVTVTSENTKKLFGSKIEKGLQKIKVITNGYDEDDLPAAVSQQKNELFTISFSGTINKQFGIATFIDVLSKIITEEKQIQLLFVGNVEPLLKTEIENKIPNTVFTGYVSHKEAIAYSANSELLLLVIPEGENQGTVPGKTFEYLATQNPILCLSPKNGSASEIIEQCEAGKGIDHQNTEAIKQFIIEHYRKWQKNESIKINNTNFKKFSRKETTKQLAEIISTIS